jgi:hypothetical protein
MSNPLNCDCNIMWLKYWIKKTNVATGDPKCLYPQNLTSQSLTTLKDIQYNHFINDLDIIEENAQCNFNKNCENDTTLTDCPENCSCFNYIIRCSHANLTKIPLNIPKNAREL